MKYVKYVAIFAAIVALGLGVLELFKPPPFHCLLPGTKISMADGSSRNIEDIKVLCALNKPFVSFSNVMEILNHWKCQKPAMIKCLCLPNKLLFPLGKHGNAKVLEMLFPLEYQPPLPS